MRFYGDVTIGSDLQIDELRQVVDAVIYAYGAGSDRRLGIEGEDLTGSIAAPEFVAWYCGHPDVHPDLDQPAADGHLVATAIDGAGHSDGIARSGGRGVGNVALDVARVLIKSAPELTDTDMPDDVLESHAIRAFRRFTSSGAAVLPTPLSLPRSCASWGRSAGGLDVCHGRPAGPRPRRVEPAPAWARDKVAARNLAVLPGVGRPAPDRLPLRRVIYLHLPGPVPTRILGGGPGLGAVQVERTAVGRRTAPWCGPG